MPHAAMRKAAIRFRHVEHYGFQPDEADCSAWPQAWIQCEAKLWNAPHSGAAHSWSRDELLADYFRPCLGGTEAGYAHEAGPAVPPAVASPAARFAEDEER